ncbi:MAG TPA: phosphate regulon sensor histidine kinase PhoR [Casimicrobiaceae bacterium]|nr:phosphate regulon sensor histidine kinase PhoR [Casimicrobiaceae bacterium]
MKPVLRKGLLSPAAVGLLALVVGGIAGTGWALVVVASGALAIIVFHLAHLQRVSDWAAGPLDADVPAGTGVWAETFSAIHRRVRLRKAYQRDLKHLIERFRKAAEAIPDGVVLLDGRNHIEWMNERARQYLGLSLPEDRGRPIANLLRQPEFVRYIDAAEFHEPVLIEQSREPRLLSAQIVPFGADERMLLVRDVTQLEAVARMRRDFIANVSHELKTPLTVVTGFVETLQDVEFEPRQRARYLGLMQDQARNMQRLVDDLLTLSALESEHNPPNDAEFAIVPLLLEVSAQGKALSQGHHEIALEIGEAAAVVGNRDELQSAFVNLVSNAIRYTPPGGAITIAWQVAADGTGAFSVVDTGIGIAPEHIPRLTERFYRIDRSRSRATGGTGLGLAIVKHVLLRHQAELDIASEAGKGSTFTVRLPPRRVRRAPATVAEPALREADGEARRDVAG